jgi:hypothetical protein
MYFSVILVFEKLSKCDCVQVHCYYLVINGLFVVFAGKGILYLSNIRI